MLGGSWERFHKSDIRHARAHNKKTGPKSLHSPPVRFGCKKTGPTSLTGLLFNIYPRLENLVVATVVGEVEIVVGAVVL